MILVDYANPNMTASEICRLVGQKSGYLAGLKRRKYGKTLLQWAKDKHDPSYFCNHQITEKYPVSYVLFSLDVHPAPLEEKSLDMTQFIPKEATTGEIND